MGAGIFEGSGLKRIKLSSTIKRIEYCAFEYCENLKDIVLPDGLTYIGKRCFYGSGLKSITFPPSVRIVGPFAFCECRQLRSALLNEGLQTLGAKEQVKEKEVTGSCFASSALESVKLPSTLKVLEDTTFAECKNLRAVEFSEGLETIGVQAFRGCGVASITTPNSLKTICSGAFTECQSLRQVVLNDSMETLGVNENFEEQYKYSGVFQESAVENVKLPAKLKRIALRVFQECKNLRKIELPGELESIGALCFYSSGLEEIVLPRSLCVVHENAFGYCNCLKTIRVQDGCRADLYQAGRLDTTTVCPLPTAMAGKQRVWDLRNLKQIVIPDGV